MGINKPLSSAGRIFEQIVYFVFLNDSNVLVVHLHGSLDEVVETLREGQAESLVDVPKERLKLLLENVPVVVRVVN